MPVLPVVPVEGPAPVVACVDFGSTFTKAALVDLGTGALLATAAHRTTVGTDVLDGWLACRDELVRSDPRAASAEVVACSSAGGGLRVAVVGNEELVTAEAGRRVALSSGGRVVHVGSGGLGPARLARLRASAPDVVLLVGGTDGGNAEVLLGCADALASARWPGPVVVAGNVEARDHVASRLATGGTPFVLADNVVPRIGVLAPGSARAAIREMFLRHVIGGKHLSASPEFARMVRAATPDAVLEAVELLARGLDEQRPGVGDVVVVDIGGATTDVHSVVEPDPEDAGLSREVVATPPAGRTVEGDLGMRWSAPGTVEAGLAEGLIEEQAASDPGDGLPAAAERWRTAARAREADPGFLPGTADERADDEALARAAAGIALRRHAGRRRAVVGEPGRHVERTGRDLRKVRLLVASGGVLRTGGAGLAARVLSTATGLVPGGWQLPEAPRVSVDDDCVLAAAGLLARSHPAVAYALLARLRDPASTTRAAARRASGEA